MKYISSFSNEIKKDSPNEKELTSIEDSRIIKWKDTFYFFHNKIFHNKSSYSSLLLDKDYNIIKSEEPCKKNQQPFEKNWGPFFIKDEIYFVYSIVPLKILKVNKDNSCKFMKTDTNPFFYKIIKHYGKKINLEIRNSTPLYPIQETNNEIHFLGIGHSVYALKQGEKKILLKCFFKDQKRKKEPLSKEDRDYFSLSYPNIYFHFFYQLTYFKKEARFYISKISPIFQLETSYEHTIEYINDMTIYQDHIYLGMGIEDTRALIKKIKLKSIQNLLKTEEEYGDVIHYPIEPFFINTYNLYQKNKIEIETLDLNKELSKILNKNKIYFNVGIVHLEKNNFLISFRSYKGNIRSWNGVSTILFFQAEITNNFKIKNIKKMNDIIFEKNNYKIKEKSL